MSTEITTAFVQQYKANITMLAQQKGSRLRDKVMLETGTGKDYFFEQIGATNAQKKTSRHANSPQIDTPHARRKVSLEDYDWGDFIDQLDKVRMLIDPASSYVQSGAYALGRSMDDAIIAAATGTAYTGETGSVSVALPSTQKVAVTVDPLSGKTNAGMSIGKLVAARSLFGKADIDLDDPMNKLYLAVSQKQLDDLLTLTEVKSSDYNTVKALVKGEIDSYMGFEFVRTQRLSLDASTDIRTCFAWAKSGIGLAVGRDVTTEVTRRADKSFAWYAYACMAIGAARLEENKVVEIACDESPA
jgi:hypothetical protein